MRIYPEYLDRKAQEAMVDDLRVLARAAPFQQYEPPRGRKLSVQMTAAGALGWVTDRGGYRYATERPGGGHWPEGGDAVPRSSIVAVTRDDGGTWFPADQGMGALPVASLVLDPEDPDRIYAGTGEGYFGPRVVPGAGVFVSEDRGRSWRGLPATVGVDFVAVNRHVLGVVVVDMAADVFGGLIERVGVDGGEIFLFPSDGTNGLAIACDIAELDLANLDIHRAFRAVDDGGVVISLTH